MCVLWSVRACLWHYLVSYPCSSVFFCNKSSAHASFLHARCMVVQSSHHCAAYDLFFGSCPLLAPPTPIILHSARKKNDLHHLLWDRTAPCALLQFCVQIYSTEYAVSISVLFETTIECHSAIISNSEIQSETSLHQSFSLLTLFYTLVLCIY